jgi:hypothetical protein
MGSVVISGATSGAITLAVPAEAGTRTLTLPATTGTVLTNDISAAGDTSAGDAAAVGYTSAEGLILTGQGSTSDVTIKNDADGTVLSIPTGTTNVGISGSLLVGATSIVSVGAGAHALSLKGTGAATSWGVGPTSAFGNFYVKSGTSTGVGMTAAATSWSSDSDERQKTTLTPFVNAVQKISTLRAGIGRYLTDEENMSRSFLIAQDVQAVLPEAVDVGEDEQQTLMLRYTDLIPLLVAAIQEQQTTIEALEARITALEA